MQAQAGILFGLEPLALPQNPLPQEQVPVSECFQQGDGGANASRDSEDTLLLDEGMYNCQTATNEFAKQNGIPKCRSGTFKEHTFLVEMRRLEKYYAKCLLCTKEFQIEMETKNNIFLGSYVHMSCVLYDEKVHILRYMEDVQKFQDTNIQLRKILMTPNMIKSTYNEQWDPAIISGCITITKPMKKCRLLDLPHSYEIAS